MDTRPYIAVPVELPTDAVGDSAVDVAALAVNLRRLWAVDQVRLHRLGVGRAAEIAAMPRAVFMALLGEHGVPVIDYPVTDLRDEIAALRRS